LISGGKEWFSPEGLISDYQEVQACAVDGKKRLTAKVAKKRRQGR